MKVHLLVFGLVASAAANMYDVIEETKVAPSTCTAGCAQWSTLGYD